MTVSHAGYIKRVPLSTYRAQRRGGRGRAGMAMREEDFLSQVFVASTHAPVLFFTSSGRVYKLKVHRLPRRHAAGARQGDGQSAAQSGAGRDDLDGHAAARGRGSAGPTSPSCSPPPTATSGAMRSSDFGNVMANGKIAMKFEGEDADDRLIAVATCTEADDVLLATRNGRCDPLPGRRRARVHRPQLGRRARHPTARRTTR